MTARDRIVIVVIAALAVLGAAWLLVVAPEREQAAQLNTQVSAARAQLSTAESQVTSARHAQAGYAAAYTSLVKLGKAVPTGQEVPSLIVQLARASDRKQVEFSSIAGGASSGSASPAAAAVGASFTQMPFTFVFNGSFVDLYHLFQQLNRFTLRTSSGGLVVSGRLLTIQSVKLAPEASAGAQGQSGRLTGTITATAYVLPASQGLTGGATATSPAGITQTTASSGTSSSATTPAVIGAGR
jgi:Tfp pilus assembly protein PilO